MLSRALAPHGYDPQKLVKAIMQGTYLMIANDGSRTNEEAFWAFFEQTYGEKARADEKHFDHFYRTDFGLVREKCGCSPKAAEVIAKVKEKGLRAILATNPLFPAVATESRIGWAGLRKEDFELITTYENSSFCKPNPRYYAEILEKTGLRPGECVMVGNDTSDDLAAAQLGIPVFILTENLINVNDTDVSTLPHGSYDDLIRWIDELC